MTIVIDGTTGISPVTASGTSASVDGMTVGRGGGEIATNTAVGASALNATNTGGKCTAFGYQALKLTTGKENTAFGSDAGAAMTGNEGLAAFGWQAARLNTANNITSIGHNTLAANTTGSDNTAVGASVLASTTTGQYNTAVGSSALQSNTTASNNTAVGYQAGYTNVLGTNNTFIGYGAGYTSNAATTTGYNTAVGAYAGYGLTTGTRNTFIGSFQSGGTAGSGSAVTTGSANSILGAYTGNGGGLDIRTASNNIVLSDGDGNPRQYIDGSGNVYFNHGGATTVSPAPSGISMASAVNNPLQIYMLKETQVEAHIGFKSSTDTNFYVGTSGGGGSGGIGVYGLYQQNVTNSWTAVSDERLKTELQPIENALEKVANVRTVTGRYTYDEENGVTRRLPFLIAQDFLTALPEAVDRQDPNKLGLSYSDTIVLAFAAIKELKAEFDAYKASHP